MRIAEARKLSHHYGMTQVLDNVELAVESGHLVGLIGPNGCGKSTLMKIFAGLIRNHEGEALVDGKPVGPESKAAVSYLPEKTYLADWMRPKDVLGMFTDFYADFDLEKARKMLIKFKIPDKAIRTMSKGTQEKLQLILVMSRRAKLYLLDEPLGGIDPASRAVMLDIIMSSYSEDSAIVISTHLLHDVERVFDRVLFMKDSKIIVDSDVDTLREEMGRSLEEHFISLYADMTEGGAL